MINCSRAGLLARLNVVNEPIGDTRAKWPTTAISLNHDRPHEPRHLGLISDDAYAFSTVPGEKALSRRAYPRSWKGCMSAEESIWIIG